MRRVCNLSGVFHKSNMVDGTVATVARWAISSRILLLFFQVVVNELILDYDSSSFIDENGGLQSASWCDSMFQRIFGGFGNWDAAYFMKIADEGYKYEQFMAFFPLYPCTLRILLRILQPLLQYFVSGRSLYLAIGWILNTTLFTLAAISLYSLTLSLFGKRNIALLSSLLFCFNPASVFMSSLYTESMFSCLQFTALSCLEQERSTLAVLLFGLGCATRSNGVLSCGFIAHKIVKHYVSTELPSMISDPGSFTLSHLHKAVKVLLRLILLNGFVLSPFVIFQLYGYSLYCMPQASFSRKYNSPWCDNWIPFSYSYIQDTVWNVGFLRYFEVKQIPNFVLAAPVIILSLSAVLVYSCDTRNLETVKTLGLFQRKDKSDKMTRKPIHQSVGRTGKEDFDFYHNPDVFVYVFHLGFMTLFGFTSIHVQVLTRFIASASPLIYWYAAHVILKDTSCQVQRQSNKMWRSQLIVAYFLSYFFIGTALHCNFYPWT